MTEIKLGDKVRDKVTGFVGIATCRTEFLNGCVQWGVQGKVEKDNKIPEPLSIDEQSLELVNKPKKIIVKKETGGPTKLAFKQRGY